MGGKAVTAESILVGSGIEVINGIITRITVSNDSCITMTDLPVHEVDSAHFVLPGFIDTHIHGSAGADVMDATPSALTTIASSVYTQGTTSFLATTMAESDKAISHALENIACYQPVEQTQARIIGVHLEGPFLSPERMGAQPGAWLKKPDIELFSKWECQAKGLIKQVTLAPEEDEGFEFIRYLKQKNIIASIGHTCCSAETAVKAIKAGAGHGTHVFNAMTGISHKKPGAATAILLDSNVFAELIVDGVHLCPEIVQLALKVKGADKIILVTDAMRAQGAGDGIFQLGGQNVYVKGNEARLNNGVLAGSVLTMNRALANMISFTGCSVIQASKMASANPAVALGLKDTGIIEVGRKADFVVLDECYQVVDTYVSTIN